MPKQGTALKGHQPVLLRVSGDPLQASPGRADPPLESSFQVGAHHPATLYEVICEVELVPTSQAIAGPRQAAGALKQQESGRVPDREKIPVPKRVRSL